MLYKHINRAENTKKAIQKQPVKDNADKNTMAKTKKTL